jgi:hypothetical protein
MGSQQHPVLGLIFQLGGNLDLREMWSGIYVAVIKAEDSLTIRLLDANTIKLLDSSVIQ